MALPPGLPLIPTTVIGRHGAPGWFHTVLDAIGRGEFGATDVEEAIDDAAALAIADQEGAGIDVVSGGEVRRSDFIMGFDRRLAGIEAALPHRRLGPTCTTPRRSTRRSGASQPRRDWAPSPSSRRACVTPSGRKGRRGRAADPHQRDPNSGRLTVQPASTSAFTDRVPSNPRYSQAVLAGDLVCIAGTLGLDMSTQTWPDQIEGQAEHALKNLEATLVEAGARGLNDVVKVTVFLTDPAHSASTADIFLPARISLLRLRRVPHPSSAVSQPHRRSFRLRP